MLWHEDKSDFGEDILAIVNQEARGAGKVVYEDAPLSVDEVSLFKMAPNAIEFCISERFANAPDCLEYRGSYAVIRDFFELRCPTCNPGDGDMHSGGPGDPWKMSLEELQAETLLVWDEDELDDVCPGCNKTRSEFIEEGKFEGYNQMHLLIGMRAGKSTTAGLIGCYVEHVFLCIAHSYPGGIHGYLGTNRAEQYEMTFLAASDVQSQDTIWSKFTGYRRNSPWFQRYVTWVRGRANAQVKSGMRPWRYEESIKFIRNEHPRCRIVINSLNSNSSSQAGRTRIWSFVDEMGRMQQTDGPQSAREVYRTQEASLKTVRSHVKAYGCMRWFGAIFSVTSPIARDDYAMELWRRASENGISRMFSRRYATWLFNPMQPRAEFDIDFVKDPVGAMRDFGAEPPGAEHPLIHDEQLWYSKTVDPLLQATQQFEYYERGDPTGRRYVSVRVVPGPVRIHEHEPRFLFFDAGQTFDSFAGACAHPRTIIDDEGNERRVTVFDWIIRLLPGPNTEVHFDSVRDLVDITRRRTRIAHAGFDRWNSVQIIQQIRDMSIPAEQMSLKSKDFVDWKIECMGGFCQMLPPAANSLKVERSGYIVWPIVWMIDPPLMDAQTSAIYELMKLQQDPNSQKVTNPFKGKHRGWNSDDVAQVIVGCHKLVQRIGYTEKFDDRSRRAKRTRAEISAVSGASGRIYRPHDSKRKW